MNTIVYLLYGNRAEYHLELTYSVLSATRFLGAEDRDIQIALVADEPNQRFDLPVRNILISKEDLLKWQLGGSYNHAAQAFSIQFASEYFGSPCVLVDTDTVFVDHPRKLFERIESGVSLMHTREGTLGSDPLRDEWIKLIERCGGRIHDYPISLETEMFNAGVIGIHPHERGLLDDVKAVMSTVRQNCSAFTAVQISTSLVLNKKTRLNTCEDVIDHYWYAPRAYVHYQLKRLLPERSAALFERLRRDFPSLALTPRRSFSEKLVGKLFQFARGNREDYAHAYRMARVAISHRADPELGDLWAGVAADAFARVRPPWPKQVVQDFAGFHPERLDRITWLSPATRAKWRSSWTQVVEATEAA
jgi:hypothetical protein